MDNPWKMVLKDLRVPHHHVPKQMAEWQYYMRTNREKVQEVYEQRETTSLDAGIALRSSIARELVSKLSDEEREALQKSAKSEWDAECSKYNNAMRGEPSNDREDQQE